MQRTRGRGPTSTGGTYRADRNSGVDGIVGAVCLFVCCAGLSPVAGSAEVFPSAESTFLQALFYKQIH